MKLAKQVKNMALCQLTTNKIQNEIILHRLTEVRREDFIPEHLRGVAYIDDNIEIVKGRFLLAPLTFARLLKLAEITPSCRVLIIGCDNGYAAAVISELAGHVVAVDSSSEMIAATQAQVERLSLKDTDIKQVKNMADGYELSAPYDVIFVNGAVEHLPEDITSQLAIGGRLVAVLKSGDHLGKGVLVRNFNGKADRRECFDASVAILPDFKKITPFCL